MRFTLNTLGAPNWKLEDVARNARAYGYAGVDLRLLDGDVISLSTVRANLDRLKTLFPRDALPISVLATSVRLATREAAVRAATLDESHAWIDLAAELQVPVIRFFAARTPPELDLESSIQAVGEMLAALSDHAAECGVTLGIETHDEFASAHSVARAIAAAPSPFVGGVWDLWHTSRAEESPAQVVSELGDRIVNVHLKDAKRADGAWDLVLLGEGDVRVKDALRVLLERGYEQFISVEWEKKWHPELAEPEIAFPHHIQVLQEYMRELAA